MEEVRLLRHEADDVAERRQLDVAHVDAADPHRARVDVVEARDEVGRRGLAAPRRPDQRHELARRRGEADVGQGERHELAGNGATLGLRLGRLLGHLQLRRGDRVTERDALEAHLGPHRRRRERDRVGRIGDLVLHLEVLEDAVEQRERALDLDLHVEQLPEREEEP